MPVKLTWVDAFTDKPFAGNPAPVCLLSEPRDDARPGGLWVSLSVRPRGPGELG